MSSLRLGALATVVAVVLSGCDGGGGPAPEAAPLEVMGVWSGVEEERFRLVLDEFERRSGARVTYTSAGRGGVAGALAARRAEGRAPDVAFLPQPGLLRSLAADGALVELGGPALMTVEANHGDVWRRLSSVDGRLYGVPFKAANKSLLWYDVAAFQRAGVVPPATLAGLGRVAAGFASQGLPAFAVAGADGWTLTDWFENLYLRTAGAERYDLLAEHRLAWTDPSVLEALGLLVDLLRPELVAGGADGALATGFDESIEVAFGAPGGAAMVMEGDFVASVVAARTGAEVGVDVDAFPFPPRDGTGRGVVGGGDIAVLMRPSAVGAALMEYLATPAAAVPWASRGGFISPNLNLDLSVYPDELTRRLARAVLDAGDLFRFDLSDLTPAAFGGTERQGMRGILQDLLVTRDVPAAAAALEAAARDAYGR
ncbi:MAG TPA: ABC transporter substrate-binding protein [Acidimicrobiales bacterium]|nr:ABC transporter substrate-binding protein [Acidimicrobiales bacterium]